MEGRRDSFTSKDKEGTDLDGKSMDNEIMLRNSWVNDDEHGDEVAQSSINLHAIETTFHAITERKKRFHSGDRRREEREKGQVRVRNEMKNKPKIVDTHYHVACKLWEIEKSI